MFINTHLSINTERNKRNHHVLEHFLLLRVLFLSFALLLYLWNLAYSIWIHNVHIFKHVRTANTHNMLLYYVQLLLPTLETYMCTAGLHSRVPFKSNGVYIELSQDMRERKRALLSQDLPHKKHVMSYAYLRACNSRVRLMPSAIEYDISSHTDAEFVPLIESEGNFCRLVHFLHGLFAVCVCQIRHSKCHEAKPNDAYPGLWETVLCSREPAFGILPPILSCQPKVILLLVFVLKTVSGFFFLSFHFALISPILSFLLTCLNSYP